MNYRLLHKPSYAIALISLDMGESVQAETGCMVSMSDTISMDTGVRGGLFGGFKRRTLGGESFFLNTFRAGDGPGELALAPQMAGDIEAVEMDGSEPLILQAGAFLAAAGDLGMDATWGGAKSLLNREGLFLLRCEGAGTLFISSYGAVQRMELAPGERYTVDNGHMVAFNQSIRYTIGKAGSWKSSLLGGEGLVCKLQGPGVFYMQTRSEDDYLDWLMERLPGRKTRT